MKLVLVEWMDSHSDTIMGWKNFSEINKNCKPLYCKSVGWLITENKDCLTVVPHIYDEINSDIDFQGCGDLTIPRKAVIKIKVLKE